MKLRLFVLRDNRTSKVIPDLFFHCKSEAKRHRDQLGGADLYSVLPGPDHWKSK